MLLLANAVRRLTCVSAERFATGATGAGASGIAERTTKGSPPGARFNSIACSYVGHKMKSMLILDEFFI